VSALLERSAKLHPNGLRLIDDQPRAAGNFGGKRSVISQIHMLIGQILADEREFPAGIAERHSCVSEP
jgi:hypothetical protein